jgi:teichoic acid transport system ATP-binding protein
VAEPMVVVDDLHIVYRVYGAGGSKGTAATALMRVLRRQNRPGMREVHAIRGISFVANRGDAVGIIGRNGSGKSTLLRAIAGLLPPEQGTVYTTGEASLLGVNAALLDDLTGERNVVLGCLAMGMSPQEVKSRYASIVDFSGVGDFIDLPMRTYSSGMGSRLRFAIASAKSHDVLLIDEALATGDAPFRAKSHKRIEELRQEAGTVFLVAHNLGEVEETCNRVIWLERGEIIMDGDDVPGIIDAYLEASGGDLATLRHGQAPDDEEADADTAEAAAVAGLALEEALEDALVVAVGDTDATVLDGDLDAAVAGPGPDHDLTALRRVLERVLQQLADDDVGGHGVAVGRGQVTGDVGGQRVLVRQRLEGDHRAAEQGGQVERPVADRQLVGAGPGTEQELLDQTAE